MKRIALFVSMMMIALNVNAQNSTKAKSLLDEVYTKVKGYNNIYVDFKYTLDNTKENIHQETRGNVTIDGDKYLFNYLGATKMFDGKNIYTIIPENEEVVIENKEAEEEGTITPSKMLTFYREGYRYAWDALKNIKGRQIQYVKLTPIDSNSDTKNILLGIDAQTKHIYNLIEMGSNGTTTTITVNSFKTNQPLSKSLFTFNEAKYEDDGYYIIRN